MSMISIDPPDFQMEVSFDLFVRLSFNVSDTGLNNSDLQHRGCKVCYLSLCTVVPVCNDKHL